MLFIQTSLSPAPIKLMEMSGAIAKPVAVRAGAHVRSMDYNVHMHMDNVKFAFSFSSK